MSIQKQFHLSIAEFAELCNSSRKTLIYYDNIGLLKPIGRTEQGYRYYEAVQVTQFHLIQLLQAADYSLEEIKTFLSNPSYFFNENRSFLHEKYNLLLEKRKKLDVHITQFSALISMAKEKTHSHSEPALIYRDTPEYFFVTECPFSIPIGNDELITLMQKHHEQILPRDDVAIFPPCSLIDISYFPESTKFIAGICHLYTPETTDFDKNHLFTLPAGHYVTCDYPSFDKDISNALLSMYHYALQNHYTITGNILTYESIFDYTCKDYDTWTAKALLPVSIGDI